MCALGHMLEERGFATVALGAVRLQMEKTRPPRGLWHAGQLGRPVGEPEDPNYQKRLLRAALGLLVRTDGPVILEDFTEDPPGLLDRPGWTSPVLPPPPDPLTDWAAALTTEMAALAPAWQRAQKRFGRTSVGLGKQLPDAWPDFFARFLAGELPVVAGHPTAALALRFLCDDIKAMYGEAAQADGPAPSANQVDTWFWHGTLAGRLLIRLREVAMASENNALKTVGGRFFVPGPFVPR